MVAGHRMWQMAGLKAQRAQTDVNNQKAAFDAAAREVGSRCCIEFCDGKQEEERR